MSDFWSGYIIALVAINVVGCCLLLYITSKPDKKLSKETTGHVWDEDLTELNNPLPRWWLILFYLTILFSFLYLILYPGLGHFKGLLSWSQEDAYQHEQEQLSAAHTAQYEAYLAIKVPQLAQNETAMKTAQRLFLNHCAGCHGSDAKGALGFPDLTDNDWLYGGTPEAIKISITQGRRGIMPALGGVLKEEGVEQVIAYLKDLSGQGGSDKNRIVMGKALFMQYCSACHGANASGNLMLGAPNLTDDIWLYGSTKQALTDTLNQGRAGVMLAYEDLLSGAKIHLLTAYVYALSNSVEVTHGKTH